MEAYTNFASVYDTFMDQTPYEEWANSIEEWIQTYGVSRSSREEPKESNDNRIASVINEKTEIPLKNNGVNCLKDNKEDLLHEERDLVVDLGCGTGTLTELLSSKGYDMIGIDNSEEMLHIAMNKKETFGSSILYLCQDMREMELYSTVGTIISVCDSINYLLEEEDVIQTFRCVNNYLYPNGIFIFDFNTIYKYETVIGDTTIAENRDDCSFIWENYYHKEEQINEYDLTIFVNKAETQLYHRFTETHFQRGYSFEQMKSFLAEANMTFVASVDGETKKEVTADSERIYMIARENGK